MTIDEIIAIIEAARAEIEQLRSALLDIRELNTAEPDGYGHRWVHSDLIDQVIFAALKEPKP